MAIDGYIAQRLSAITQNQPEDIEALKAENARLKQQLGQLPTDFKSEAQVKFEQSPEFEAILNTFFMRFLREKFGVDFRDSPQLRDFQLVANQAFSEFEKNYRKETDDNGTPPVKKGRQTAGNGSAPAGEVNG